MTERTVSYVYVTGRSHYSDFVRVWTENFEDTVDVVGIWGHRSPEKLARMVGRAGRRLLREEQRRAKNILALEEVDV